MFFRGPLHFALLLLGAPREPLGVSGSPLGALGSPLRAPLGAFSLGLSQDALQPLQFEQPLQPGRPQQVPIVGRLWPIAL